MFLPIERSSNNDRDIFTPSGYMHHEHTLNDTAVYIDHDAKVFMMNSRGIPFAVLLMRSRSSRTTL